MNSITEQGSILLVDKPLYITSFGAVKRVKHSFVKKTGKKRYKVGHAGTLDPLATGLLIICAGKKTKEIVSFQNLTKEYTGIIKLGATTPSFDLETEIDKTFDISSLNEEEILEMATSMEGETLQTPPIYSAKKIEGKRAYDYARKGEEVNMNKALVNIHQFEITKIQLPVVHFKITCSKGTYIRSIAYDFGKNLNNGGHLIELRRTKIGKFSVEDALSIEETKTLILESNLSIQQA